MMYVIKMSDRMNDERIEMKITAEDVFSAIDIACSRIENPEETELIEVSPVLGTTTKMTVREFIAGDGDIDIVDDVCEDLWIAVCRPVLLTEEGQREFSEVMNYEVEIKNTKYPLAILLIDQYEDWEYRLKKAEEFFCYHAGYCSDEDWNKWFYLQD